MSAKGRVVLGSDHAGFELKTVLMEFVKSLGYETIDVGTHSTESVDYPDYAVKVAEQVLTGRAARGILLCGSGVGASVAANKIPGIRAGNCEDYYSAHQGVEHDDMNVLCLGGKIIGPWLARDLINTPASDMGPAELEAATRALAERHGASVSSVIASALGSTRRTCPSTLAPARDRNAIRAGSPAAKPAALI